MLDTAVPLGVLQQKLEGDMRPQISAAEHSELVTHRLAALGEMTGGVAHDFRNLLAAIEAGLKLALKKADDPDNVRVYIDATREAIDRGFELTSQLLAFANHQQLESHAGDINEFLRSFEPLLRYGAGPGVRVKLELGTDIPTCMIDPALFDAAVLNLVINARDAMPSGGEVLVGTERLVLRTGSSSEPRLEVYARVRVVDRGCGMSAEVLRKAFDPFFTTKGDRGTGIGLPQVRAFMHKVGGQVRISSEPGIGTTVDLLFPSVPSDM